jgi:hypothetical protein
MNKRKWYNYIFETQDELYQQKLYKVPVRFKVKKLQGGNKSETEDDFRAVNSVTSLSLPRDRKSDGDNWYMTYDVKFDLPKDITDVPSYVRNKLIPELNAVKGVEILSYGEAYQVYDAQDDSIGNPDKDRSKVFGGDKRRLTKRDDDISGEG